MNQKGISSIIIILIIVAVLVIGGGVWYHLVKTIPIGPSLCSTDVKICPDGTSVSRISPGCEFAPCPEENIPRAYIENGVVYYINERGEKSIITESKYNEEDPVKDIEYRMAKLSPNKKFIALGSIGWEIVFLEVYDIASEKIYQANATGSEFGDWLPDSRLKVFGECGMGIDCGIFESKNNQEPWVLEKISDFSL